MKEIPLSQGLVALVDDDMFEELSKYNWHASKHRNTFYAIRNLEIYPGLRTTVKMHRQVKRALTGELIDHWNGNGLDNQLGNLRVASSSQNSANKRMLEKGRKSRYKGVSWHKQHGKWYACIFNKKQIFLGLHTDEVEAARAYDRKAIELFGEFAQTNFPASDYVKVDKEPEVKP